MATTVRREDSSNSGLEGTRDRTALFVLNGEYWTVGYAGKAFSLKASKGLAYIHRLLRHPNEEFHVLDLLSGAGTIVIPESSNAETSSSDSSLTIGRLGDAGEMLDSKAKQDYKRRLFELREGLEDARQLGNCDRAAELESEIDFLAQEISRAVGLGGRNRRAGSAAERARLNVTRAVKAALQKISEREASLGALLDRRVKTGLFCSYSPDPRASQSWQFAPGTEAGSREVSAAEPRASEPLPVIGESSFLRSFTEGTTFVGREAEREILTGALEQALSGHGKMVLIGGAAGVGKTRIGSEIAAEALRRGMRTFVGSCYDRDDAVPFIPFVEILEESLAQTRDLAAFRAALGNDAPEIGRLLPRLRRMFPDIPRPLDLAVEQSRRILFAAASDFFARLARNRPMVFLLDDLHWADEGTLLLLNHLAQLVPGIPMLIVGTYRDFEVKAGGQLSATFDELIRRHLVERVTLDGLPRSAVAEMLSALGGRKPPDSAVQVFYSHTEGNPFFIEELFLHLVERGKLTDANGDFRSTLSIADIDVPQSVRLVIGRRLARLSDETRKVLGTAAVIGRSFTFELLEASSTVGADALLDCIDEAERGGLIASSLQYPEVRFKFAHELIRRAVLDEQSGARRQRLHLSVAETIEQLYPDALDDHAEDLAHHLLQAGAAADAARTIRFLSMAAKRARLQGALTETGELYRDALRVLERMPDNRERDQLELGLQLGIGAVLMATRGYADAGTGAAYQRASDLGERLGDPTQVVLALTGLVTPPLLRGELDAAKAIADQALAASQRHGKSKTQIWGHHIAGVVEYHRGQFASAWDLLGQAHAEYREEEHSKNPHDPGILVLEYMALTAWQLGMADTARSRMREALSLSDRLQKPFGLARCSFYAGYLHALMRDPGPALEFSEKSIKWSTEYSIQLYLDASRIVYGWAIAKQGRGAEGVACLRAAIESFKAADNRLGIATYLGFLADALSSSGSPEVAIAAVEQGLSLALQEPMDFSYLWWLKGELLLKNAGPEGIAQILRLDKSSLDEAEKSFRTALSIATNIGAKSYALRSATSLGRLLLARGKGIEARGIVEPLLKSTTEGFDTRDCVDATQLVADLS